MSGEPQKSDAHWSGYNVVGADEIIMSSLTLCLALSAGECFSLQRRARPRSSRRPSKEALISRQRVIVYPVTPRRGDRSLLAA